MNSKTEIPERELDAVLDFICSCNETYTAGHLTRIFESSGARVDPDAFSAEIVQTIRHAVETGKPLSAIRIGDGEGNLLTYLKHRETPVLDEIAARKIIEMQGDRFNPSRSWLFCLKHLMQGAVCDSDILGVRGLASFSRTPTRPRDTLESSETEREEFRRLTRARLRKDPRGTSGYWRSIDHLAVMSQRGLLNGKLISSAHIYFALLNNIEKFRGKVRRLFLISNRQEGARAIADRIKPGETIYIGLGTGSAEVVGTEPSFLLKVEQQLPPDMAHDLCLIGAGPWSEIYCSMIKNRGGVGVDLGSGFDLAEGRMTRPIHRSIAPDRLIFAPTQD